MAQNIVDQLIQIASTLTREQGRSTLIGAAEEIKHLRNEIERLTLRKRILDMLNEDDQ